MTTTITIDGSTVFEQRDNEHITHHCATVRVAQILAAELELRAAGWTISEPSSVDGYRHPLLLPDEKIGLPLDGTRSDERAQGFAARRSDDALIVDACAGLPPVALADYGDTADARRIVEWHLGSLS